MKLKPLQQWICDTCGEVIASPADGWVEWVTDDKLRAREFRIVHHILQSPHLGPRGCYRHEDVPERAGMNLVSFLGADGLGYLLAMLDLGRADPEDSGPQVRNTRELAELIRRLHIPQYEEARQYWKQAEQDGYFGDANEVWPYLQKRLTEIVERYGPK